MIGIDIGSQSIKIVETQKEGGVWKLKSSGAVAYPGLTPEKMTEEKDFIALAEIIRKMAKQIKLTSKEVNISLPEQVVFTRVIKFPDLTEEEIVAAVKWEAEQYIPIPIAEAVIQHLILQKGTAGTETLVLLIAVPKAVVEKYIKVINLTGLIPLSAETELMALARSVAPETGVAVLLDFGVVSTDMAIIKDSKLCFTRAIPVAGDAFTRAVSQALGVSQMQAEEYKKTYGLTENQLEGKVKNALLPIFNVVIDEIKKAIHFYQTEEKGEAPSSIIITGGTSLTQELVSFLTNALGIETQVGNPFKKITLDAETSSSLAQYISLYGTAVGLALREE